MRDGTIKLITYKHEEEDKDLRIRRLEGLLKEVTDMLAQISGYDKPVAAASTYDCYK
jgi:hypothetical protein